MLGGRIIMAIGTPNTDNGRNKARFVKEGNNDRGIEYLIHTQKTVGIRNIRLLITLATIHKFEVWYQDVTQAYIKGDNLSWDVYVKPTLAFQPPPPI